jgi:hypothetical protein
MKTLSATSLVEGENTTFRSSCRLSFYFSSILMKESFSSTSSSLRSVSVPEEIESPLDIPMFVPGILPPKTMCFELPVFDVSG